MTLDQKIGVTIQLQPQIHKRLQDAAQKRETTMAAIVRELIRDGLDRLDREKAQQ